MGLLVAFHGVGERCGNHPGPGVVHVVADALLDDTEVLFVVQARDEDMQLLREYRQRLEAPVNRQLAL